MREVIIEHRIQKHIIGVLIHTRYARFSELRPPGTDTNLFSYHLKVLIRNGYVQKTTDGYTLGADGLGYVDRVSIKRMNIRSQPKIITMLVVRDDEGRILLQRRAKQPYIDTWTLPYGKTHIDDRSIADAAMREAAEKLGVHAVHVARIGDAYIRVNSEGRHLTTTLAHMFDVRLQRLPAEDPDLTWYEPERLATLRLAPAVERLIEVAGGEPFFVEIDESWE